MRLRTVAAWWLLALLWLGWSAGWRPLHLPDEARYVGVAWEMLRSGDWLTPTLNGAPFFHKPPLFYWITAASISTFGFGEFAARVAPLLAASLCTLASAAFVWRWLGRSSAQAAFAALLTQPLFFVAAQYANLDVLVAACISVTIWLLAHAALQLEHGGNARLPLVLAYGAAALGVLAKGLIGMALPGLVLVLWLSLRGRWRILLQLMWCPLGLLLFLSLTVPWFALMQQRFDEFLSYFFVVHHFKRYAAEGFNNVQPWYFYPALLLAVSLPLWPWLRRAVLPTYWRDAQFGAVRQLLWIWVLGVTLFFSLPQSKPLGYILPVLPALAALAADAYAAHTPMRANANRWLWRTALSLSAAFGVAVVAWFAVQPHKSQRELGQVLAQQRRPAEPVVALHRFPYDVPLYAHLQQPMVVVEDWQDPDVKGSDSWPKELSEAARFLPQQMSPWLIAPQALPGRLCAQPVNWLIGHPDEVRRYAFLSNATRVYASADVALWRVPRDAAAGSPSLLNCPTP